MFMKHLHFMKQDKNWFYIFNNSDKDKTFTPPSNENANGWIWFSNAGSKTKALSILNQKFPEEKPIFTEAYVSDFTCKDKHRLENRRYKQRQMKDEEKKED